MVARSVGYAYRWDFVGDPGAARRAAEMGLDSVAVAASYHSTRAGTPLHPEHRVFEADSAAFYLPVRADAWSGHRLVPVIRPGIRPVPRSVTGPAGETTDGRLQQYLGAGMRELHLYHLGLLGRQGLAAMRSVIERPSS